MSDRGTPGKPSTSEDEYFVREDAEKKRRLALQAKKEKEAAELKRLKDLHFMHCPKCGLQMQEVKFRGVDVINLNDLANALKPAFLPGETMEVSVITP